MSFGAIPGLKGKVFVPELPKGCLKKHPCRDCFACQQCSDDRCRVCLNDRRYRCANPATGAKEPAACK